MGAGCHACPSFAVGVGRGYPEIDEILTLARVWDSPPLGAGSEGNPAREWEFITSPPQAGLRPRRREIHPSGPAGSDTHTSPNLKNV